MPELHGPEELKALVDEALERLELWPELHGQATWAAGVRPAPNFTLRDQSGHLFTLASLRGHTVALAFLDSHCTQECPLAGRALAQAEATLPAAAICSQIPCAASGAAPPAMSSEASASRSRRPSSKFPPMSRR